MYERGGGRNLHKTSVGARGNLQQGGMAVGKPLRWKTMTDKKGKAQDRPERVEKSTKLRNEEGRKKTWRVARHEIARAHD